MLKNMTPKQKKWNCFAVWMQVLKKKATMSAIIVGLIGALVMGTGMSLLMTDLGEILGLSQVMIPGIVIGVIGMIGVGLAYPIYNYVTKKERERVAPEIIRLTDELMK